MMHFMRHMTHSPYPVPQLPPHLRHALSNIWSKTSLCSFLKAPCHQEKPHVVFLESAYFWAQGKEQRRKGAEEGSEGKK